MIRRKGNIYKLDTPNTTLLITTEGGKAEYLYYGKKLTQSIVDTAFLRVAGDNFIGRTLPLVSTFGEIDSGQTGVRCSFADGSFAMRFAFVRAKLTEKPDLSPLPSALTDEKNSKTLCMEFVDEASKLRLLIYYTVFADCDAIAVSSKLVNGGRKDVFVHNLPSLQLDLRGDGYEMVTFRGGWADERNRCVTPITGGAAIINESRIGSSSHYANPFVEIKKEGTVYAFNLIYSGNHKEVAESNRIPRTRVMVGMNDFMMRKKLAPSEEFVSPEAVMCFGQTEDETTAAMHDFVNNHILRGKWKDKERPILINNWEATYFNFNQEKLLALADEAAALGIELFVLDDGWFGKRDTPDCSLGDWVDYKEKTGGLATLAENVRSRGLKFGIWLEPEMISENSELYRKHPEYAMKIPGRDPLRMRWQLMLNLADPNVQKYVIRAVSAVITETKAAYVKWDYNRYMSDCFSKDFPGGEYFHEYMKGLYTILAKLTEKFPSVLFESCAGGGGRFDLGMLCYMPQTWTSDDTDARCRMHIQSGTSYGYPQSAMSCHVSASPNHQTGNASALETRFNVAMSGAFGYELDATKLTDAERDTIKKQITFYKKHRKLLQFGKMYRLGSAFGGETSGFICVNETKTQAIACLTVDRKWGYHTPVITLKGLDSDTMYELSYRKQDNYSTEPTFVAGGDLLMNGGIALADFYADSSAERSANSLFTRCLVIKKYLPKSKRKA